MHFFTLQPRSALFQLDDAFISQFIGQQPQWGAIGYVTFKRTYSRSLVPADDGTYEVGDRIVELASRAGLHDTEEFWLTMVRVIEGMYQIQQRHCSMLGLRWDAQKAQESAQEAYQRAWDGKWLPPGRGLWMMGAPGLAKVGGAALLNCSFVSTKDIDVDFARPFTFMMDMSMLGVGVGFDCRGVGRRTVVEPQVSSAVFSVEDSREGWAAVLQHVLRAYVGEEPLTMSRDYSRVRAAGARIKGFGGVSAGPEPLIQLIERDIPTILGRNLGLPITSTSIVDVMNCIGRCVVSGNVRRSAQIALGDMHDAEFRGLKNPESQQEFLNAYRWASNNTVMPHIGDDYDDVGLQTATNGEPGYLWLENAHNYARMNGVVDTADRRVLGVNPCFAGSTLIGVADGRGAVALETLAAEGRDVPVYSVNPADGKVEIKWGRNPRITGEKQQLVAVELDDGTVLQVTPNHKFLLNDGTTTTAAELQPGSSLPRFKKDLAAVSKKDPEAEYLRVYRETRNMWQGRKTFEHRVVAQWSQEQSATDLRTKMVDNNLVAVKTCEECHTEFEVPWRARERAYCQHTCSQKARNKISTRLPNLLKAKEETQREVLHSQIQVFKDLEQSLQRIPMKKEWTAECKARGVPSRTRTKGTTTNPYAIADYAELQQRAETHNHRVVSVKKVEGEHTVYNITVDDFHTVAVVTAFDATKLTCDGVFTPQCGEQQLESDEGCNLGETFPARHDSAEDFKRTLKFAYLYCKTVTLIPIHDETTNAIQMRNRRIGLSQSGIITAMSKFGRRAYLKEFCDKGYDYVRHLDDIYSEWLCVPRSVRVTTVKPSGTVSLLFGVAPGIHYPHAEFYIRRMRIAATSALAAALKACGYRHEPAQTDPHGTLVFEFPVREEFFSKGESDVSMWEQLENAADLQRYWSDNAVSITVKFKPDTEGHDIPLALSIFESRLKSVSFLPEVGHGYVQAPYEATTEEDWIQRVIEVHTPFGASASIKKDKSDMYCDSDRCVVL